MRSLYNKLVSYEYNQLHKVMYYSDFLINLFLEATDLLSCCCVFLLLVSHHGDNPTRIANHGLIPHLLKIVSHNSDNTTCISPVCSLLWSLTVTPHNLRTMTEVRLTKLYYSIN